MFDIGASELFLVAIVALIVLGPERLPKAARFAGLWVRRARAQWYSVRSELERELAAEELQRSLREGREAIRDIESDIRSADADVRREFDAVRKDVERTRSTIVDVPTFDDATAPADGTMLPLETKPDASHQNADADAQEPADVGR